MLYKQELNGYITSFRNILKTTLISSQFSRYSNKIFEQKHLGFSFIELEGIIVSLRYEDRLGSFRWLETNFHVDLQISGLLFGKVSLSPSSPVGFDSLDM